MMFYILYCVEIFVSEKKINQVFNKQTNKETDRFSMFICFLTKIKCRFLVIFS